jgi:hypothetical protein
MLISPDAQFAYVSATEGLYTYSIDAFGTLSPVGTPVPLQIAVGQDFAAPGSRRRCSWTPVASSCT